MDAKFKDMDSCLFYKKTRRLLISHDELDRTGETKVVMAPPSDRFTANCKL